MHMTFDLKYNLSAVIVRTINPLDRCKSLNEIFNESMIQLHLVRRIKYYYLPCQNHSLNLPCFYDEVHMCFCHDYGDQSLANCIEFDHHTKPDDLDFRYDEK